MQTVPVHAGQQQERIDEALGLPGVGAQRVLHDLLHVTLKLGIQPGAFQRIPTIGANEFCQRPLFTELRQRNPEWNLDDLLQIFIAINGTALSLIVTLHRIDDVIMVHGKNEYHAFAPGQ